MKIEIPVSGMSCSHCENAVNTAVGAVPGVKKVKANAKKSIVKVEFDEKIVEIDAIEATINDAGYTVGESA
ncbi:hypothetical protein FACS189499_07140 [Clostridia bacterium]|nr:hypothetical protein FACS189499_07140 [Clostridia bacterium]